MFKKALFPAAVAASLLCMPAHAAWNDAMEAAIASGNFAQLAIIEAQNPKEQSDMAMFLLDKAQTAQEKGDICLTVSIFENATPLFSQLMPVDRDNAKAAVAVMRRTASTAPSDAKQAVCNTNLIEDIDGVDADALLAQSPGTIPHVGTRGALIPSAE